MRLEALRQRYGLSFSPLREALMRLQSERLVVSAALRGFAVAPLSREEIKDATETRILISHASPGREGILAQLALTIKVHMEANSLTVGFI